MSELKEFTLPDVGEGLTEAELVTWHVSVGDLVSVNDPLCDVETAKSVVELPSPHSGVVVALLVEPGTTVPVGTVLIQIGAGSTENAAVAEPSGPEALPPVATVVEAEGEDRGGAESEARPLVLVGPGPKPSDARRRRLRGRPAAPVVEESVPAIAGPGEVAADADAGAERRVPVRGVRKVSAQAVTTSAFTAPHVTEWLSVDVTDTMTLVRRLKSDPTWRDVRVTPLLLVAQAFVLAVRAHPDVNASWDEDNQEIVYKSQVNLGIAAATPRGLIVPNIKDAGSLSLRGLAERLDQLVTTARAGKTLPADMSGGTVTITNIGALGVDAGTPILNPGESAILAFGAVRPSPWVIDGQVVVRDVTQLAMSFDHRHVDGELGSRVLATTGALLREPQLALAYA